MTTKCVGAVHIWRAGGSSKKRQFTVHEMQDITIASLSKTLVSEAYQKEVLVPYIGQREEASASWLSRHVTQSVSNLIGSSWSALPVLRYVTAGACRGAHSARLGPY